jgi:hypothetical protein
MSRYETRVTVGQIYRMPTPLAIALALSLAGAPSPQASSNWLMTGRLIDRSDLHLGVRPAVYFDGEGEKDLGVTIQLSTNLL